MLAVFLHLICQCNIITALTLIFQDDQSHEDTTCTKVTKAVDLFYQQLGKGGAESDNESLADESDKASVRSEILGILEDAIKSEKIIALEELDDDLSKQSSSALARWTKNLKKVVKQEWQNKKNFFWSHCSR